MKRLMGVVGALLLLVVLPVTARAVGIEAALGVWDQRPAGDFSYRSADNLNLRGDLGMGDRVRVTGRVKIDAPFLPGIYLMATPMEFRGTGGRSGAFSFGGQTYAANTPVDSRLSLDHYDLGLTVGLPFLKLATLNTVNVDLGIDARLIDLKAELSQPATGVHASVSRLLVVPMAYAGVQVKPVKWLAAEGEVRGMAWSGNHYYDLVARAKVRPFGPSFVAAGYRYEKFKIDVSDIRAQCDFGGPFAEVGIDF